MSDPAEPNPSLLQLALSLRLAAQRLADSAARMQQAAEHQRQQLDQLALLRDRLIELLAVCRRLGEKDAPAQAKTPAASPGPASRPIAPPPAQAPQARPRLPASAFVEFSNWQEFEKFRRMPPISEQEVDGCNIEELLRRLTGGPGPK
jgi:hypothetical protein